MAGLWASAATGPDHVSHLAKRRRNGLLVILRQPADQTFLAGTGRDQLGRRHA